MPSQFPPELNPEPLLLRLNGSGGTDLDAFSTGHAAFQVDFRFFRGNLKVDAVVRTGFDTGLASGAGFIRETGNQGGDDADVLDLGLRACVGAFRKGDSELMVVLEVFPDLMLQERKEILCRNVGLEEMFIELVGGQEG